MLKKGLLATLIFAWLVLSLVYDIEKEEAGFIMVQLAFLPLVVVTQTWRISRSASLSILSFWIIILYGLSQGPYATEIGVIPFVFLGSVFVIELRQTENIVSQAFYFLFILALTLKVIDLLGFVHSRYTGMTLQFSIVLTPVYLIYITFAADNLNKLAKRLVLFSGFINGIFAVLAIGSVTGLLFVHSDILTGLVTVSLVALISTSLYLHKTKQNKRVSTVTIALFLLVGLYFATTQLVKAQSVSANNITKQVAT